MPTDKVTVLLAGDTGTGKSSFGNYYLGVNVFQASDSINPVTLEAIPRSNRIGDCIRTVIDTEGLNDGQSINAVQIQNLAHTVKNYEDKIHAIVVVLNGQYDRFSQGVKDIIKFAYNSFGTKDALNNICVVFTKCYDTRRPDRQTKNRDYKQAVRSYLSEVSGAPIEEVPEVPIFFVDCYPDEDNTDSQENLTQFHGWVCSRNPLDPIHFREANYREDYVEETRTRVSKGFVTRGDTTYELFEDQKRTKIIPNNKDPARYTDWICTRSFEEAVKKVIFEKKNNVDLGYKYSNDGSIRYKVHVDQERKIVRDLRTGKDIETTPWYNSSEERKTEAGRYIRREETRNRKFEKKEVEHHGGHGLFGGSDHTHYKIFHTSWVEKRTITTDYDGRTSETDWCIVSGSQRTQQVGGGEEGGHTCAYEKEI